MCGCVSVTEGERKRMGERKGESAPTGLHTQGCRDGVRNRGLRREGIPIRTDSGGKRRSIERRKAQATKA